jgi:polyisoprenyl-phosphate glycosyltransferase
VGQDLRLREEDVDMYFPIFLSIVLVVKNQSSELHSLLTETAAAIRPHVSDYELIVIDNASQDDSVAVFKGLTEHSGVPNVQVYALTKEVDADIATAVGLESALGDFITVIDPLTDDIAFLPDMLEHAVRGADVVFATNQCRPRQSIAYRICFSIFDFLFKTFNGIYLAKEAPHYRVLSRRVANFILQHPTPLVTYRHLPATGGFSKINLTYRAECRPSRPKRLGDSIERGVRLLVSTTRGPMRLVTSLSLFGAFANLVYSGYVIAIAVFKTDVAPGWVTLSLQQSGMFFLISLVLLVLGEYILQVASSSTEGPLYHVAQEFSSAVMPKREKLNVEDARVQERARLDAPVEIGIGEGTS